MLSDMLPPAINPLVSAASGLIGVLIGGWISTRSQKRERQQRFLRDQLGEFYGPMLALRAQIFAKGEVRQKVSRAADATWRDLIQGARSGGTEGIRQVREERGPIFSGIIEYENRQLAEDIIPSYCKMVDLFATRMHLAEHSTREHFAALIEFVELWNRWLAKSIPGEVIEELGHSEEKLYALYEDLAVTFEAIQQALKEKPGSWH